MEFKGKPRKEATRRTCFVALLLGGFLSIPGSSRSADDIFLKVSLFSLISPDEIAVESPTRVLLASDRGGERECHRVAVRRTSDRRLAVICDGGERRITDELSLQTEPADGLLLVRVPSQAARSYSGRLEIVPAAKSLAVAVVLPVREYLYGVVGSEMGGGAEALRAQSILSRTYAIFNRGRHHREGFDFCDTTHCQHFTGRAWATPPVRQAVDATVSLVLSGPDGPCGVFFHSTCGGRTTAPAGAYPCLREVDDGENCSASPHYRWQATVSVEKFKSLMKDVAPGRASDPLRLRIVRADSGGWVGTVSVVFSDGSAFSLSGEALHLALGKRLGWNVFKSSNFTVARVKDAWVFTGKGLGHGMGLCQWGARRLAARGWPYDRILRHYFPSAEIKPYSEPLID